MRNELSPLIDRINQHKNFLLLSHIDPDGDAIGSLIALSHLLRRRGKRTVAYDRDGVPEIYRFLPGSEQIVSAIPAEESFEAAIFLECPTVGRAGGECEAAVSEIPFWINIDHHLENARFGHLNIIDPKLCAVGEVIYGLYEMMQEPIDSIAAHALYTAVMTDTGSFKYTNTTPRGHVIAAELIKLGVNPYEMYQNIYENLSAPAALITARAHSTLTIDDGISCITITRAMLEETGATAEDTHDIVNLGRPIQGVEVALLFRETDNGIKVSLRSKNLINVSDIAVRFGGGGHLRAAGCTIHAGMEQAKELIYAAVREALKKAHEATRTGDAE